MELLHVRNSLLLIFFNHLRRLKPLLTHGLNKNRWHVLAGVAQLVGASTPGWGMYGRQLMISLSVSLSLSPLFTKSISIFFKFLKEKQKQVAIGFGHGSPAPLLWDRWLQGQLVETLFPVKPLQRPYLNLSFAISSQIQNDGSLLTEVTSHTRTKRRGGWRLSWC